MATPRALSLPYARAPMSQMGNEPYRIVEDNGSERFVVFPSRLLTDGLFFALLACTAAVVGFAALMWHESAYRQGLGSVPYLGLLGFLMWFRFTHSREQLEFEVTPEELIRTVFRPRGQSEQRWSRQEIRFFQTEPSGITLVTPTSRSEIASAPPEVCRALDAYLHQKLAITPIRPTFESPTDAMIRSALCRLQAALNRLAAASLRWAARRSPPVKRIHNTRGTRR